VFEGIRSPTVHMPKTINELAQSISRVTDPTFFAGGTYIMNQKGYYPSYSSLSDIIYLGGISEFQQITRNDKYLEFGAAVHLQQLLSVGKQVLPKLLYEAIEKTGTEIIRSQMTIGGVVCIKQHRLLVCSALATLDADVEIRSFASTKPTSKWIPIKELYKSNGLITLKKQEVVSKIRVSFEKETFSYFITAQNPMKKPEEAVIISVGCWYNQSVINQFRMCIIFPTSLFLIPEELSLMMNGTIIPLSTLQIDKVVKVVMEKLSAVAQDGISSIQIERAKRCIESSLHSLNAQGLTMK